MQHKNSICSRKTGWITSELYYWHDTQNWCGFYPPDLILQPGEHFENPETKRRFENLVRATGLAPKLVALTPEPATDDVIASVHPQQQIDRIRKICAAGGGEAGDETPAGAASLDIARLAVGGVTAAVDAVFTGEVDNAYVLCRPPGHHALPSHAMGFCIFANAAIGVQYARQQYGVKRVAMLDWDVHHGNGSEAIFIDDADVLTISLHQDNLFPANSGGIEIRGNGGAIGSNLNIPLPPGSGSGAYRHAFAELVIPALEAFKPELIVVPCGFDASALDPLGVQMLSSEDFRWMMQQVLAVADKRSMGRVIATHEGGYSATYVPYCGLAVLEEMSGTSSTLTDPFLAGIEGYGGQSLSGDQKKAVQLAKEHFFNSAADS